MGSGHKQFPAVDSQEATIHLAPARLVLAMTISAQIKSESTEPNRSEEWKEGALQRLGEAMNLAPEMKVQFGQLKSEIKALATIEKAK